MGEQLERAKEAYAASSKKNRADQGTLRDDVDRLSRQAEGANSQLAEANRRIDDLERSEKNYRDQLNTLAQGDLLAPSAEKFPTQFAAASGALGILTGATVSMASTLSRLEGLTFSLRTIILVGIVGVVAGLAFHAPPLWAHWKDWKTSRKERFEPGDTVADLVHGDRVLRFQGWTFGFQASVWLVITTWVGYIVATA